MSAAPKKARIQRERRSVRCKTIVAPSLNVQVLPEESYDWAKYLDTKDDAPVVGVHNFNSALLSEVFIHLKKNLQLEVPNPDYDDVAPMGVYWIAHVEAIKGYRALLRYDGYEASDSAEDFWMSMLSADVHPVGWCADQGKPLVPPKKIEHKYSDWKAYLVNKLTGGRTLPGNWQDRVADAIKQSGIWSRGTIVEVLDRAQPDRIVPAVIKETVADRMHLDIAKQYKAKEPQSAKKDKDETAPVDEMWFNCRSHLVFPVGWATRVGYKLHSNKEYAQICEKIVACDPQGTGKGEDAIYKPHFAAPAQCDWLLIGKDQMKQANHSAQSGDNGGQYELGPLCHWEAGMKLECVDVIDMNSIHVATVKKDESDNTVPVHVRSPYIFPVGSCKDHHIKLDPPDNFDGDFEWEAYLKQTQSLAAPADLFERAIDHKMTFEKGAKLEALDASSPKLMCVATVADVKFGRLVKLHFDGWGEEFEQWQDYRSPDLKPIGWCEAVGYKLEAPQISDNR